MVHLVLDLKISLTISAILTLPLGDPGLTIAEPPRFNFKSFDFYVRIYLSYCSVLLLMDAELILFDHV